MSKLIAELNTPHGRNAFMLEVKAVMDKTAGVKDSTWAAVLALLFQTFSPSARLDRFRFSELRLDWRVGSV